MKTSRIDRIILAAEQSTAEILGAISGNRARRSAEGVNAICTALVRRKTPIMPTAHAISEEGRSQSTSFPSLQTIYNQHSTILKVWRDAYYDVVNINADAPISEDQVQDIDASKTDGAST